MSRDKMDDIIRDGFNDQKFKAPEGLWNEVKGVISEEPVLDNKIKEGFEDVAPHAPDHVWDGINKQLNIDRAWDGVLVFLNRRTAIRRALSASLVLLLLLFVWGGYDWYSHGQLFQLVHNVEPSTEGQLIAQQDNQTVEGDDIDEHNHEADNYSLDSADPGFGEQSEEAMDITPAGIDDEAGSLAYDQNQVGGVEDLVGDPIEHHEVSSVGHEELATQGVLEEVDRKSIWFNTTLDLVGPTSKEPLDYEFPTSNETPRWIAGGSFAYNRTWIVNNDARAGRDKYSLVGSSAGYASSMGIWGRYQFDGSHSVMLAVNQSSFLQNFNSYQDGHYLTRSLEIKEIRFALSYRHDFSLFANSEKTVFLTAGPYVGTVIDAHLKGDRPKYINNEFQNRDWGVSAAIGQSIGMGSFRFEYGIRGDYGMTSIFSGNSRLPAEFNLTELRSVGGFVSLGYIF